MEGELVIMELENLIKKEKKEFKERIKEESGGAYVLMYFFDGLYVLISVIWGFYPPDKDIALATGFWFLGMGFLVYTLLNISFYKVKENGQYQNIFRKYLFTPVNGKDLFMAKAYIISRNILVKMMLSQTAALITRIATVCKKNTVFFDWTLFIPLFTGIFFWIYIMASMYQYFKQAGLYWN